MSPSLCRTTSNVNYEAKSEVKSEAKSELLIMLLRKSIVHPEDWERLSLQERQRLHSLDDTEQLLASLTSGGLITHYQKGRISARTTFGLTMGNYRVLDRLGAGGMGVVFRAEHLALRNQVALKVIASSEAPCARTLSRFQNEMRVVASLHHPNIVAAIDAGIVENHGTGDVLHYFAMELVPGHDLEELVNACGPMSVAEACDCVYQIAAALAEAHKLGLVHRDIKPSNVRVTPAGEAKLLDFGLALAPTNRMTSPGVLLGTLDYIAPEQASDASSVDVRADVYSLGGTLYWCLTGQSPFADGSLMNIAGRETAPPPAIRDVNPKLPSDLERIVQRMLAGRKEDRYPSPREVMEALVPFLRRDRRGHGSGLFSTTPASRTKSDESASPPRPGRVLVVDDELAIRSYCKLILESEGINCETAEGGPQALEMMQSQSFDVAVLDVEMPALNGTSVLKALRETPPSPHLKIVMLSGRATPDELAKTMLAGADDFLTKPMSVIPFLTRIKAAIRLKAAQDQADAAALQMSSINDELERTVTARSAEVLATRNTLVEGLVKMVEARDPSCASHLQRMRLYCRCLGDDAAAMPAFQGQIDDAFLDELVRCAPLHDLGKVGLPDNLLLKPGKLERDERLTMQTHSSLGGDMLQSLSHDSTLSFLKMAADIARHHHEWYDGSGYPDRLKADEIPLAARIVAIADVYDALRSRRCYKPALDHAGALRIMLGMAKDQFDPNLLEAFERCAGRFDQIHRDVPD